MRRPSVFIGPGFSSGRLEVVEDEMGVYERWRSRSTEEPVTFYSQFADESNEHIARRGLLITRADARATVLVMHGYTSSKIDMGILRLLFSPYNLLLFDFRAHGEFVEGQSSTLGCDEVYDVFAAVDFLRSHAGTKDLPIIAYGFSMGAVTAIEAQAHDARLFNAMVIDCPFDSTQALIKRGLDSFFGKIHIPVLDISFEMPGRSFIEKHATDRFMQPLLFFLLRIFAGMDATRIPTIAKNVNAVLSSRKVNVPVFMIGCYADDRVPVDAFVHIYQELKGYKRLWITHGARHFGSLFNNPELYQQMVVNFIEKNLNETITKERVARILIDVSRDELRSMHERNYHYAMDDAIIAALFA
jgi:alpha-beta hydrolase superfamily lysophospholipase